MAMKGYSAFPEAPALLKSHYQIIKCHFEDTRWERGLTLCKDTVSVFFGHRRLGHRTIVGGILPLCRDAVGAFCSPSRLGHRTIVGGILPLCRDAVGVFCSPSRLGHRTLVGGGQLTLSRDTISVFDSPSRLGKLLKMETNVTKRFLMILFV